LKSKFEYFMLLEEHISFRIQLPEIDDASAFPYLQVQPVARLTIPSRRKHRECTHNPHVYIHIRIYKHG